MFSVLFLFCIGYAAGQTCQQAGSLCYRVSTTPIGVVGGSCCNSCRPYVASGSSWDGTTDWYCQYGSAGGSAGQSCGTYTGNCATGLTCTNGVCSSSSSSSNTTVSSVITTTTSSADATITNCTTTSTTAAAGDVCEDTNYNITKTCCSPYTCSNSLSSRTKLCAGADLAVNDTCFSGGVSVGACGSGMVCLGGVCTETGSCAQPVYPTSICKGENSLVVATCCSGSYCVQPASSTDSFCMRFDLAEGEQCGMTQSREYRGQCALGADHCINGVCSSSTTTSTTTTTVTTTTVTTTTVTTVACVASGATCWSGVGPPTATCCSASESCNLGTKVCQA